MNSLTTASSNSINNYSTNTMYMTTSCIHIISKFSTAKASGIS